MMRKLQKLFADIDPAIVIRTGHATGDGSCLFHSIAQFHAVGMSAKELRQTVAACVLDENYWSTSACESWQQSALAGLEEGAFYRDFARFTVPLSLAQRRKLSRRMNTTAYWGDHYALKMLSIVLKRRFLVVAVCDNQLRVSSVGEESLPPEWLLLENMHYSPLFVSRRSGRSRSGRG